MSAPLDSVVRDITKQLDEGKITKETYVKLLTEATAQVNTKTLDATTYLAEQAELQYNPWMRIIKEAESWWQDVEELTDAQMKERFIALARQKRLPPTVVLVCLYTLFTPDKEYGRVCLMKLLLFGPHNKTMQYHNYQIYKSLHSQERRLFGEILENCPMPLFPPYSEIANLNEDVRDIVSHGKLTGGSEMNEEESPFKALYATTTFDLLEGGSYAEPIYNAQGEQVAAMDISRTENILAQVTGGLKQLTTMLSQHTAYDGNRGRGRGRGQRYGRGYSTYRGRGGNGPWGYGGGVAPNEASPKKLSPPACKIPGRVNTAPVNCLQTEDAMLEGGNFAAGKTNNVEIDRILQHYFPGKAVLRCDTLPSLTPSRVFGIEKSLQRTRRLYFPLFLRSHWIAGILEMVDDGSTRLKIYDSAPSEPVHKDLRRIFVKMWPSLTIVHGQCARQCRHSDDCGLFMVATFCAARLDMSVTHPASLPRRLRAYLAETAKKLPPHKDFWTRIREILGAQPAQQEASPLEGGSIQRRSAEDWVRRAGEADAACARRGLRYMLAATALTSMADGVERSLSAQALAMRSARLGFNRREDVDVRHAFARMGLTLEPFNTRRVPSTARSWFLMTAASRQQLPRQVGSYSFVLGVRDEGRAGVARMPPTRVYRLTQQAGQSVVGLYARQTEQTADEAVAAAADRDTRPRPVAPTAPAPVDAPQPTGSQEQEARQEAPPLQSNVTAADEEDEDRREALQVEPEPLNWQGRRNEAVICPREWILYSSRPRHVSQLTWAAVTPTIRQQHIRWLRELKTMPSDLLQLDLATAALTLVNRMHWARRWKWSTHTKALSNIRAALFNLPLYSNVQKRVDLTEYPQWTAAITAAHRFERETPSNPPPPIDIGQYRQAREHLRLHPIPSLYLGMMWAFAARAGDIGQLKARDVHFNPTTNEAEPTIRVSLTVRRGKGARFRGPYTLASRLLRADASVLQQLLATRGPGQLLFSPLGPLKDTVRAALRLFNPSAALPSVRKGAARCLADNAATDTEVMRLTGHTRVATLQRYLDYGRHLTAEAVTAQDNAARALLVPNTSA